MHIRRFLFLLFAAFVCVLGPPGFTGQAFAQSLAKTFTLNAANQNACIGTNGLPTIGIDVSGTSSLTLQPQVSINGSTPKTSSVSSTVAGSSPQATIVTSGATTASYVAPVGGFDTFCLNVSAYTSGSATVVLNPSPALNAGLLGGASPGASSKTYFATANGLVCNGTTDDTAALNSLLSTVVSAGGGTIAFPVNKTCLFSSAEITLPNNNDTWTDAPGTVSSQPPMHWTCDYAGPGQMQEIMSLGATLSQVQNGCVLNLTFNATDAKLVSLGMGVWEMDHLSLIDSSTDCASFVLVTNTQPYFHDNQVIGTTASQTGGPYSCNNGFIMGGSSTTATKTPSGPFQGYAGAKIERNFFNQIQSSRVYNTYANTILDFANTDWAESGCATCGAVQMVGPAAIANYGNLFLEDNIEAPHYLYGIQIANANQSQNTFENINCSDIVEFSTKCVANVGASASELVIGGTGVNMLTGSDFTTDALIPNLSDPQWPGSFHWNGYVNLMEQPNGSNGGGVSTGNIWADKHYQRVVLNNHGVGKQRAAVVEELPTTQVATATDNFTRANSGTLGANWTTINSLSTMQIVSNTAQGITTAIQGNYYSAITFPNDQWSQCTIGTIVSNSSDFVMCPVRVQSAAESFYTVYATTNGSSTCTIRKFSAGTQTDLATCTPLYSPLVSGDVFTITAVGSTITIYQNSKQIATATDASFPSGAPGIAVRPVNAIGDIAYTAWAGGSMDCNPGVVTSVVPGLPVQCSLSGTSAAFATATTAGTCVQSTTAITGATTSMTAVASPVSTPGVGAVWSAFVSSAGNVTINECAVATSAGGTIAFNIRLIP